MEKKESARDKWNREHGLISKSYKLNADIAEKFADACKVAGISQKAQLEKMMKSFINNTEQL